MARNKYLGSWQESSFDAIERAASVESFRELLVAAVRADPQYTHQQIADWSNRLWWAVKEGSLRNSRTPELDLAAKIALDVDAQWEMFLSNTYSLNELQSLDCSQVKLPLDWFQKWLLKLEEGAV